MSYTLLFIRCLPIIGLGLTACLLRCQAHVHIQIRYAAEAWDLHILDFDAGKLAPADVTLFVASTARQVIGEDPRYHSILGPAGQFTWILPQLETATLLNLGLGTSGITPNTFAGNQVRLLLRGVDGPGHFGLFTTTAFGAPNIHFNSRDGIDTNSDVIDLPAVNGHVHVNWSFSAPGEYRIRLAAAATLLKTGQLTQSPEVIYSFVVEGPPAPQLSAPRVHPDGSIRLTLNADPGSQVEIQSTTDFERWQTHQTLLVTHPTSEIRLAGTGFLQQFFRARIP